MHVAMGARPAKCVGVVAPAVLFCDYMLDVERKQIVIVLM